MSVLIGLTLATSACGGDPEETLDAAPRIVVEGDSASTADAGGAATGGSDGSLASDDQTDEELALEFAQCMRDQGIDFDDPVVNADGSIELIRPDAGPAVDPTDSPVRDAFDVCGDIIDGASFLPGADLDQTELEDTFLEFAQCLRDQGFDVDDPDLSGGFGPGSGGPGAIFGDSFDITDPANADAVQECQGAFGAGGRFGRAN